MLPPDPAAGVAPLSAESLPDDVATLQRMVVELAAPVRQEQGDNAALRQRLDLLLRRLNGRRGERIDPNQLLLFATGSGNSEASAPAGEPPVAAQPERRGQPHGRRRLPLTLPRQTRHHELPEAARLCAGCGRPRLDIGVDRSEQLDYRPASLFVIEHLVHKYVCPCCSQRSAEGSGSPGQAKPESSSISVSDPDGQPPAAAVPAPAIDSNTERICPGSGLGDGRSQGAALPPGEPDPVVLTAPRPASPIAKGLPGPGLLAHVIVSKYVDHLPLHRLERVYERQGLLLPRSTLCDWLAACAQVLRPLYARLVAVVLQSRCLHTDDMPVKMQERPSRQLSTARLWCYLGDAAHPYHVFDFTQTRKRDGPQQFLAGYQGYLQADAFSGYDALYLPAPQTAAARIIEVACNAHARRKFYEARRSDAVGSHQALAYYGQLYELERGAQRNGFSGAQRLQMRQELALPILARFRQWLEGQRVAVLPKSPMAEAIGYALNNWTALIRYTEAGFLAIDNNAAEREMKRIAIGRKNWLFVGSPQGGQTAAVLLSVTSTCQRLGVEPWTYLQDVLTRLPALADGACDDLLPDRWQAARAAQGAPPPPDPASSASSESRS
jgi:transposase